MCVFHRQTDQVVGIHVGVLSETAQTMRPFVPATI